MAITGALVPLTEAVSDPLHGRPAVEKCIAAGRGEFAGTGFAGEKQFVANGPGKI